MGADARLQDGDQRNIASGLHAQLELEVKAENEEAALAMVKEYEGRAMRGSSPFGDMVFQQTGGVDLLDPQSYEDCENDILELDVGAIERIREEQEVFR